MISIHWFAFTLAVHCRLFVASSCSSVHVDKRPATGLHLMYISASRLSGRLNIRATLSARSSCFPFPLDWSKFCVYANSNRKCLFKHRSGNIFAAASLPFRKHMLGDLLLLFELQQILLSVQRSTFLPVNFVSNGLKVESAIYRAL